LKAAFSLPERNSDCRLVSRLSKAEAQAAQSAAAAATEKIAPVRHFCCNSKPPTSGPRIDPTRPMPNAHPIPVALIEVG
jgi:hypothetical protein